MAVRILVYGMSANLGGTEMYIVRQWRGLDHNLVIMDFVSRVRDESIVFQDEFEAAGCRVFHLYNLKRWKQFLLERANEYNAVVFNTVNPFDMFCLELVKKSGIPRIIIHSHNAGFTAFNFPRIAFDYERFRFKRLGCELWACSDLAGKWMFGDLPFLVLNNGIETEKYRFSKKVREDVRSELSLSDDNLVIGHVGRFQKQKNHRFLIHMFSEVLKREPRARLLLVGDASQGTNDRVEIENLVSRLGLSDVVLFLGLRPDVERIYQAMDVFVLPSLFEGFPFCGVEASCSGLPCLYSDTITREIMLTGMERWLPITGNEAVVSWAEAVIQVGNMDIEWRNDMWIQVKNCGYDSRETVKKVQRLFLEE